MVFIGSQGPPFPLQHFLQLPIRQIVFLFNILNCCIYGIFIYNKAEFFPLLNLQSFFNNHIQSILQQILL